MLNEIAKIGLLNIKDNEKKFEWERIEGENLLGKSIFDYMKNNRSLACLYGPDDKPLMFIGSDEKCFGTYKDKYPCYLLDNMVAFMEVLPLPEEEAGLILKTFPKSRFGVYKETKDEKEQV